MLKVDQSTKRVSIAKTFVHPQKLASPYEGNLQALADGGAFVGWGGVRKVTEFTPAGKVRFELKLPFGDTYRGFRLPWNGEPTGVPRSRSTATASYASWNGRLDIDRWDVLAGADAQHLHRVAGRPWSGLETTIGLEYAAAGGCRSRGRFLGPGRSAPPSVLVP